MPASRQFVAWARETVPALYSRAVLLTGDPHGAEDLVQETLTTVYLRWDRLDQTRNVDGYAMRTLYHHFVSRRRRRSSGEYVTDDVPALLFPAADNAQRIDLARALDDLKPVERALVVARYADDLSIAQVAALLGRSEGWVKVTSQRALAKLRVSPRLDITQSEEFA